MFYPQVFYPGQVAAPCGTSGKLASPPNDRGSYVHAGTSPPPRHPPRSDRDAQSLKEVPFGWT